MHTSSRQTNSGLIIIEYKGELTSKAVSNCSHGTASQLGYAFSAADSL